ncbi:Sperm-tail PG-rich repeat-containing protein 2 [Blastocladiella emersonii ATCC 22665]|nr:Sperm-tail PG-rich repeat-containing protein 2 [Blastocladiella emersonii ATCC 22665]
MYSRTARHFSEPTTTTNPNIGPGYYQEDPTATVLPSSTLPQAAAPFSSITPRVCYFDEVARRSGPAPGTYEPADVEDHQPVKAVPFGASRTPRFADPAQRAPGPGSYDTTVVDRPTQLLYATRQTREPPPSSSRIQWKRKFVPPSIPYGAQSYGYEESSTGDLTLRKLASASDASAKLLGHGGFIRESAGTSFAKSTSKRQLWKEGANPGPGNYNVAAAWQAFRDKKPEWHPSHESRCIRFGDYVINEAQRQAVPGPGSYDMPRAHASHLKKGPILSKAVNSSITPTADPFSTGNPMPPASIPGPGAYDIVEATKQRKPLHVAMKPFNSSENRKLMDKSSPLRSGTTPTTTTTTTSSGADAPGPGKYTIATSLLRKSQALGRPASAAPFGTATQRFSETERSLAPAKRTPGPATYTSGEPVSRTGKRSQGSKRLVGPVHQFSRSRPDGAVAPAFGTQRERFAGSDPSGPPPGTYDVAGAYTALRTKGRLGVQRGAGGAPDLGATPCDRSAGIVPAEGPGPGEYEPSPLPRGPAAAARAVFVSRQPRLVSPRHTHPAPNAYGIGVGSQDPMVRRTFNATLPGAHHPVGASVATALAGHARGRAVGFRRRKGDDVVARKVAQAAGMVSA